MVKKKDLNQELFTNEKVIDFLKKNKDFLIKNSKLLEILDFPSQWKINDKVIDFNIYKSKKLKEDNKKLKAEFLTILNAGRNNVVAQNRIFKASLKIINTRSINHFLETIINDCPIILGSDVINIFSNNKLYQLNKVKHISEEIIKKIFKKTQYVNLKNDSKFLSLFFPSSYKTIESYVLLKIPVNKKNYYILSIGSKDKNKFSPTQGSELISFFSNVCEIKIKNML